MAALSNVQSTASRNSRNTVVKLRPYEMEEKDEIQKKCQGGFNAQEGVWRLFVAAIEHLDPATATE